ncbi:MAG: tripartite tricarboxylate transporter permease [Desulfobacterales bacterium]|nr:tripartite tricarboxylate transporter permease [Desulfobacterales bacterium]
MIGFLLGILPGGGRGARVVCGLRRREAGLQTSRRVRNQGAIEGVAAPESGQQRRGPVGLHPAADPGAARRNVVMALLLGALILHGVTPGPLLLTKHPDIFWGVIASMYLGNIMLLVLNLPLIGLWVRLLRVPYPLHGGGHRHYLHHRGLQHQELGLRRGDDDRLRGSGVLSAQGGSSRGAAGPGDDPGEDSGELAAKCPAGFRGRPDDLHRKADLGHAAGGGVAGLTAPPVQVGMEEDAGLSAQLSVTRSLPPGSALCRGRCRGIRR